MNKTIILALLAFSSNYLFSQVPIKAESVQVNGKSLYYEVYGEGEPLILLHGYSLSSLSWKPYVTDFDKEYKVYLIDLTGHGMSEAFKEKLSIEGVAKDVHALIQYLKLDKLKAVGFSFGGDVLYQLALLNPTLIESMITIGAVGTWDVNEFTQYQEAFNFENRDNFPWLTASHKSDEQIKAIMNQFKNYTVRLSDEEIGQIQPEVLVIMGDDDEGMDFDEVARIKKHLAKSDIWILPNVAHSAHEGEGKEEFVAKAKRFLSKAQEESKE